MKSNPLVSIGMPVYNGEKYLEGCINKLLQQEYKNIEIIISDNASTDATEAICKKFASMDKRIKYFRNQKNIGMAKNFNKLVEMAGGKYFMWASYDDYRHPSFLSKCVPKLEKNDNAIVCVSNVVFINDDGERIHPRPYHLIQPSKYTKQLLIEEYLIRYGDYEIIYGLFRLKNFKKSMLIQEIFSPDFVLSLQLILEGEMEIVDEELFFYRWNPKTIERYAEEVTHNNVSFDEMIHSPFTQLVGSLTKLIQNCKVIEDADKEDTIIEMLRSIVYKAHHISTPFIHEVQRVVSSKVLNNSFLFELCLEVYLRGSTIQEALSHLENLAPDKKALELKKERPILIWGAGLQGIAAFSLAKARNYQIIGYVDNSIGPGVKRNRLPIYHSDILKEMEVKPYIIVAIPEFENAIHVLDSNGYSKGTDYFIQDSKKPYLFGV